MKTLREKLETLQHKHIEVHLISGNTVNGKLLVVARDYLTLSIGTMFKSFVHVPISRIETIKET